jgi:hypothetical protein
VVAAPLIGCDEFPVGYSLAGCPPAEPASASPTGDDSQQSTLPYNDFSANGNYPLNFVSQSKGALQHFAVALYHPLGRSHGITLLRAGSMGYFRNSFLIFLCRGRGMRRIRFMAAPAMRSFKSCRRKSEQSNR